jgi:hypothetical protein
VRFAWNGKRSTIPFLSIKTCSCWNDLPSYSHDLRDTTALQDYQKGSKGSCSHKRRCMSSPYLGSSSSFQIALWYLILYQGEKCRKLQCRKASTNLKFLE